MDFASQLRSLTGQRKAVSTTLNACVQVAYSVGQFAEQGRQHLTTKDNAPKLIGAIQVGEYLVTGRIPKRKLVETLIHIE